jgi:hypothetical protein
MLVAAVAVVASACGDPEDASLCTAFDEFLESRAQVRAIDPDDLDAAEARELAESYLASVRRLRQAADSRYTQELGDLETAANDVLLTLASVQDDADVSVWSPLVEDDLEIAADLAAHVEDVIEPSCTPDTSD